MSRNLLIAIAAVALGIAGAVSSAQAGDNQSGAAAHAATKDKGVSGRTHLILIQRRVRQVAIVHGPLDPVIGDDFEGYPHPK
jgi:hypothetical protein